MDPDGIGQVGQGVLVKTLPRLIQPGLYLGDGQGDGALVLIWQVRVAQQGVQPPAQPQFCISFCHFTIYLAIISSASSR